MLLVVCVCVLLRVQFGVDWLVCAVKPDRSYMITKVDELLPSAFNASALQLDRQIATDGAHN